MGPGVGWFVLESEIKGTVIVVSVLLSLNHNGILGEGHMKPTLMQINSL